MVKTRNLDIARELKSEEDIRLFLEASFEEAKEDSDPTALVHALGTAARAKEFLKPPKENNQYAALINSTDPPFDKLFMRSPG